MPRRTLKRRAVSPPRTGTPGRPWLPGASGGRSLLGNVASGAASQPRRCRLPDGVRADAGRGRLPCRCLPFAAVGQLLLAGDEPGDAIAELSAAADRERSDLWLQIQLALALWQTGDGRGAVTILDSVIDRDGGLVEARRVRGGVLADLGEGNKAISDLNQAAPDVPSSQAARGLALAETATMGGRGDRRRAGLTPGAAALSCSTRLAPPTWRATTSPRRNAPRKRSTPPTLRYPLRTRSLLWRWPGRKRRTPALTRGAAGSFRARTARSP